MPLSVTSPVSFQDLVNIYNEFGPSTRDALSQTGLLEFWQKIFGTGTVGQREILDFNGMGRPEINTLDPQQVICSNGDVTVRFRGDITFNSGLTTGYRFQYDTENPMATPSYTTVDTTGSTGIVTQDVSGFSIGDTVYCIMEAYNAFNDEATSDYIVDVTGTPTSITLVKGSLTTPSIINSEAPGLTDIYVEFTCDSNFGDVQYNWIESPSQPDASTVGTQITTFNCENNLGTANAEASLQTNGYTIANNVWIKIRILGNDCYNHSNWSNWVQAASGNMSNPCI